MDKEKLLNRFKNSKYKKFIPYAIIIAVLLIHAGILIDRFNTITGINSSETSDSGTVMHGKSVSEDYVQNSTQKTESSSQTADQLIDSTADFDVTKIIYIGNIMLYTDDYINTFDKIKQYASQAGGFVENSNSSYIDKNTNEVLNSGYITIRVPASKYEEAMSELQKLGNPISATTNSTNISQQYEDIQGQLKNLKIQEERLIEYLKKAVNITEMLTIENELNRVRTQIDYRTTLIKNWDNQIAYSTIYVSVYEKELATSTIKSPFSDMLQSMREGFIASINLLLKCISGIVVLVAKILPFALIASAVAFVYFKVVRSKK